jgi:hypothetical protein
MRRKEQVGDLVSYGKDSLRIYELRKIHPSGRVDVRRDQIWRDEAPPAYIRLPTFGGLVCVAVGV